MVLAGLSTWVWWSDREPAVVEAEASGAPLLPPCAAEAVTALRIGPEGKGVALERAGEAWQLLGDPPRPAEAALAELAARSLCGLESLRGFDAAADISQFGLGSDARTVSATVAGAPRSLRLGDAAPVGEGRYASVGGAVHLVDPAAVAVFDRDPLDFRDRRVLPLDPAEVTGLSLRRGDQELSFERRDRWWFLAGEPGWRAETAALDGLVQDLVGLSAAAYGGDVEAPTASVSLQLGGRSAELVFAASTAATTALARGDALPPGFGDEAVQVDGSFLEQLPSDPAAWRALQLVDFNPYIVDAFSWEAGGESFEFARSEGAWTRGEGANSADAGAVQDFLTALDGLRAVGFVQSAEGAVEVARIEAAERTGRSFELVLLRSPTRDVVRVEGEPGLREVDARAFELLGRLDTLADAPADP